MIQMCYLFMIVVTIKVCLDIVRTNVSLGVVGWPKGASTNYFTIYIIIVN